MAFIDTEPLASIYPLPERGEWKNEYYNDLTTALKSYLLTIDGSHFTDPLVLELAGQDCVGTVGDLLKCRTVMGDNYGAGWDTSRTVHAATGAESGTFAQGDNTTDDTAPLQLAITGLGDGCHIVVIPPGRYRIDELEIAAKTHLTIMGCGPGTILKGRNSTNLKDMLTIKTASSHITIKNLTFDGNSTSVGPSTRIEGIVLLECDHITIENCIFQNFDGNAIISRTSTASEIKIIDCTFDNITKSGEAGYGYSIAVEDNMGNTEMTIDGCYFTSGDTASRPVHLGSAQNLRLIGCHFEDNEEPVTVQRYSNNEETKNLFIIGNTFEGGTNLDSAIYLHSLAGTAEHLKDIYIYGNIIKGATEDGIRIYTEETSAAGGFQGLPKTHGINIRANIINGDDNGNGVHLDHDNGNNTCPAAMIHSRITANCFADQGFNGIGILLESPDAGAAAGFQLQHISIIGNVFDDPREQMLYGVYFEGSVDRQQECSILYNIARIHSTYPIFVPGGCDHDKAHNIEIQVT